MNGAIGGALILAIEAYRIILFVRVILSWLMPHNQYSYYGGQKNEFYDFLCKITDPVLDKFKVVVPIGMMRLNVGVIIVFILLGIAKSIIVNMMR